MENNKDEQKVNSFPPQRIPNRRKTKKWAETCIRFAENYSVLTSSSARKSAIHKKKNYQLFGGKLNMADIEMILNPEGIDYGLPSKKIQHYPVMNAKINLLLGEERASTFENRIVVSNPTSISEIEQNKIDSIKQTLQDEIVASSQTEEEVQQKLQEMQIHFQYEYQDMEEKNANDLFNHYKEELNFAEQENNGFLDALIASEEIYYCGIEGGEPFCERVNLKELRLIGSNSNRVEDYPMVVRERFLPISDIVDMWGDKMSDSDYKKLDRFMEGDKNSNILPIDPISLHHFKYGDDPDFVDENGFFNFEDGTDISSLPYDISNGVRVLEVFWKTLTEVYCVHYFDENGEEQVKFRTSGYVLDEAAGETKKKYWINEAWHGVMIGAGKDAIFVDVGPCLVQHNRIGNPSKCHFGFVGNIYNNNDYKGMSVLDMMKPLAYKYDVTMAKLDELVSRNLGKVSVMDFARVPANWDPEKWAYWLKNGLFIVDSMKEGMQGAARGKLAGGIANTPLVADAELGNSIQQLLGQLQFIDQSMSSLIGITPQRLGEVQNRETVGGIERATMQSSHITRALFSEHEDLKKRKALVFLDYAKIAARGKNIKFRYVMADKTVRSVTIDGDQFSSNDYGMIVESGFDAQALEQSIDMVSQAKMQNQQMRMSTYIAIKTTKSQAEKIMLLRREEAYMDNMARQAQQSQQESEQQAIQMELQKEQARMQHEQMLNTQNNETKIAVAQIQAQTQVGVKAMDLQVNADSEPGTEPSAELAQRIKEHDDKMKLERERLAFEKEKSERDNKTKREIAEKRKNTTSK